MALHPHPGASVPTGGSHRVAVVAIVSDSLRARARGLIARVGAQEGVEVELVLVDRTSAGNLALLLADENRSGAARIVREPSPSRGLALRRALDATTSEWIALWSPVADYAADRLRVQLEAACAPESASIEVVTCDFDAREDASYAARIAVDLASPPPGCFADGILVRRDVLASIEPRAFAPVELALVETARGNGSLLHVPDALFAVSGEELAARTESVRADVLLRERRAAEPRVTIVVCSSTTNPSEPDAPLVDCLEAWTRQRTATSVIEIVSVHPVSMDELGAPNFELVVPYRCASFAVGASDPTYGARGDLVLFTSDDLLPDDDCVLRHLQAHREMGGRHAAVVGGFATSEDERGRALAGLLEREPFLFDDAAWEPGAALPGPAFRRGHTSVPAATLRGIGGFDFELGGDRAIDMDFGLRLERAGTTFHYRPECRTTLRRCVSFDELRAYQHHTAIGHLRYFIKHPDRLSGTPWVNRDRTTLASRHRSLEPFVNDVEAAARTLADVDLAKVRAARELEGTADELGDGFETIFRKLNTVWWNDGLLDGFTENDMNGFSDVFARWNKDVPPIAGHAVLLRPPSDATDVPWTTRVETWFARFGNGQGDGAEGSFLMLLADAARGLDTVAIEAAVAPLLMRARRNGFSTPVAIAEVADREDEQRIFRVARAWIPTGSAADVDDHATAVETSCPMLELEPDTESGDPYWALCTEAAWRVLAWPKWDDPRDLTAHADLMLAVAEREDVCIVLRHCPDDDAAIEPGLAVLQATFDDMGIAPRLELLIESAPLQASDWIRMARSVDAVLHPRADHATGRAGATRRAELLPALERPVLSNESDVRRWIEGRDASPACPIQVLKKRIVSYA